jgi:hypothetical protein
MRLSQHKRRHERGSTPINLFLVISGLGGFKLHDSIRYCSLVSLIPGIIHKPAVRRRGLAGFKAGFQLVRWNDPHRSFAADPIHREQKKSEELQCSNHPSRCLDRFAHIVLRSRFLDRPALHLAASRAKPGME